MGVTDPEIRLLLSIVKGNGDKEIPVPGVDVLRLIRLSYRHKVAYQVYMFAQKHPDIFTKEQITNLNEKNLKVARQSLIQLQELKNISTVLAENNVPFACIKGPQLSRMLYGPEALKESVDLDIMLTESTHLRKVDGLLKQLGYSRSNIDDYPGKFRRKIFLIAKREVHYFNRSNRCAVDLHIRPGANTYLTAKYFKDFLTELRTYDLEGTTVPVLHDEAYFVYLCYHGALHQFMRLAWLLDIRAFLQLKYHKLNFNKVVHIARTLNVERSVQLTLLLLAQNFGDDFKAGPLLNPRSARIRKLALRCHMVLSSPSNYSLSIKGRFDKVVYIMRLVKGFPGKVDWIYGIFMRQLINLIKRQPKSSL